jgi:hypothetical protein
MSETMILSVGVFVFSMLVVGLGLTVWEFRYGLAKRTVHQMPERTNKKQAVRWPKAA